MNRHEPVEKWLENHNAKEYWNLLNPDTGMVLTMYMVNGRFLMVQYFEDGGWEIYVPVCEDNKVDKTLLMADRYVVGETETSLDKLRERAKEVYDKVIQNREEILQAFVAQHGVKPDEVEMVEQKVDENQTLWYVRKRDLNPAVAKT